MPIRRLSGWEPSEYTTFYDPNGNVTGHSVTTRETEWSADDVASLLAARRDEFVPRNAYGIRMDEATDPANQYRFEVPMPVTDFAIAKLQNDRDRYEKQHKAAKGDPSLIWTVRLPPE